jgi:hypothetical protein
MLTISASVRLLIVLCTLFIFGNLQNANAQFAFEAGMYYSRQTSIRDELVSREPVWNYDFYGYAYLVGYSCVYRRAYWQQQTSLQYGYIFVNGYWQMSSTYRTWYWFEWRLYRMAC